MTSNPKCDLNEQRTILVVSNEYTHILLNRDEAMKLLDELPSLIAQMPVDINSKSEVNANGSYAPDSAAPNRK